MSIEHKKCAVSICGRPVPLPKTKYCSSRCRRQKTARAADARRSAISRGSPKETALLFDPIEIFERDEWTCQLCGRELSQSEVGKLTDHAPTLDHVTPCAQKGPHSPGNTQLVCRKGNCEHQTGKGCAGAGS